LVEGYKGVTINCYSSGPVKGHKEVGGASMSALFPALLGVFGLMLRKKRG
jgi:hypothetical protein